MSTITDIQYYFAYGSNMDSEQMTQRLGYKPSKIGTASLQGYEINFLKYSELDRTGKASIGLKKGSTVEGVIFELNKKDIQVLDGYEDGYSRKKVTVQFGDRKIQADTYVAKKHQLGFRPSEEYVQKIVNATFQQGLSDQTRKKIIEKAGLGDSKNVSNSKKKNNNSGSSNNSNRLGSKKRKFESTSQSNSDAEIAKALQEEFDRLNKNNKQKR